MQAKRSDRATRTECDRCGRPVLRQRTGLPWAVTADAERLTSEEAAALAEPNRLAWCLRESQWTGARLAEVHHRHCEFAHVIEHQCPPEIREFGRRPEGGLW